MKRIVIVMGLVLIGLVMTGCGKTHGGGNDATVVDPPPVDGDDPPVDPIVDEPSDDVVADECYFETRGKSKHVWLCCPVDDVWTSGMWCNKL